MKSITKACLIALGIMSCQGVTQNVETLRAERIEIVDGKGAVQMDVATKLRTLEERVQKLEAALEKKELEQRVAPPVQTQTPPPSTASAPKPKPTPPSSTNHDVF